ncbi:MAG TPA: ATP synthase F1 subunit delta [Parachlamydiaceae bacterium]|nr:ATP synthase F1 subunit delta [Parachlamydiaceae bacterium]
MITSAIATHYSKALFNQAKNDAQLEKTAQAMKEITRLLKEVPEFRSLLLQPFITIEAKKSFLKKLFQENSDPGLLNFLYLLLDKKRMDILPEIAAEYIELVDEKLERLEIGITTTVALDEKMKDKITRALENRYRKKVLITESIDPQILGGMVLEIGNQVIDGSVKAQLSKLKDHLLATTV